MKVESIFSFLRRPEAQPWIGSSEAKVDSSVLRPKRRCLALDDLILSFSPHRSDRWFLRDAVRGAQVFGAIGSGKTSGSGKKIKKAFLKHGMGGLVLCVKTDEADEWEELITKSGRAEDLIRIRAHSKYSFNFLDWEQKRSKESGGGFAGNVTDFFLNVISVIDRDSSSKSSEGGFWMRTLQELLNNAIVIASHLSSSTENAADTVSTSVSLTIPNILRVIDQAPNKPRSLERERQASSYREPETTHPFDALCDEARQNCQENRHELENSIQYFNYRFAALAEKTRSIIVTSFTSMADPLLRAPLLSLFCEGTAVKPEDTFDGKIIVVDLPVHSFQMVGRVANLIWKTAFKRACQGRVKPEAPVFLWIDESQYLVDSSDGVFQTTSRSSLCCSVFLTQTISNLYAEFGDRSKVEALMSCLHTKIFHQNDDHETNSWASKTIQKLPITVRSESTQKSSFFSSPHPRTTVTESIQWEEDVPGRAFLNLKSGGPEHKFLVEGIVLYGGKKFSNGKPWLKVAFNQKERE